MGLEEGILIFIVDVHQNKVLMFVYLIIQTDTVKDTV